MRLITRYNASRAIAAICHLAGVSRALEVNTTIFQCKPPRRLLVPAKPHSLNGFAMFGIYSVKSCWRWAWAPRRISGLSLFIQVSQFPQFQFIDYLCPWGESRMVTVSLIFQHFKYNLYHFFLFISNKSLVSTTFSRTLKKKLNLKYFCTH